MAVPDLIFRQKHLTMNAAMNVKTMLADFLSFVTPKCMHKARFLAVGAAVQSLMQNGQCTVTAIGRGFDSKTSEKHGIKRADRLLKNEALLKSDTAQRIGALLQVLIAYIYIHNGVVRALVAFGIAVV